MFLKPLFTVSSNLNGHSRHDKFAKFRQKIVSLLGNSYL